MQAGAKGGSCQEQVGQLSSSYESVAEDDGNGVWSSGNADVMKDNMQYKTVTSLCGNSCRTVSVVRDC